MQKSLIILLCFILLLGAGLFFLLQQEPIEDDTRKEQVLVSLKSAAEAEDYPAFARYLKTAYEKGWNTEQDFESIESASYVKADQAYFIPGNYQKTLEISTIVYTQVPQGWRFQYLRVLALEKLGRMPLEQNNLAGAEEYAFTILKMTFRPEGANLLADVYIQKIEESLAAGNLQEALNQYAFIKDFEISDDRRARLNELMFNTVQYR
jgi:tetratricopeptide (TPR) repeat protein